MYIQSLCTLWIVATRLQEKKKETCTLLQVPKFFTQNNIKPGHTYSAYTNMYMK